MSFYEAVNNAFADGMFWLTLAVIIVIACSIYWALRAVSEIKCAKYEAFQQHTDSFNELSNFYSWLVYHYDSLDTEADPDQLAKAYLRRHLDHGSN